MADLMLYQEKQKVAGNFVKQGEVRKVKVIRYDNTLALVIAPVICSTYFGGSDNDIGYSIALDASCNAYIAGETYSANCDITQGHFR